MLPRMAAIRRFVVSEEVEEELDEADADAEYGPERPRGFAAAPRPSRSPSNSEMFGGSCFVESDAACKVI